MVGRTVKAAAQTPERCGALSLPLWLPGLLIVGGFLLRLTAFGKSCECLTIFQMVLNQRLIFFDLEASRQCYPIIYPLSTNK